MSFRLSGRLCILVAMLSATACVSWHTEAVPQSGSRAANQLPSQVNLFMKDGRAVSVRDARVVGDSLFGQPAAVHNDSASIRVALADIRELEARRPDIGRSILMAGAIVFGVIATFALLLAGEGT